MAEITKDMTISEILRTKPEAASVLRYALSWMSVRTGRVIGGRSDGSWYEY